MSAPSAPLGARTRHRSPFALSRPGSRLGRSGKIRAVLALGAVIGLGTVATLAAWSDTGAATGSFSTGSLDLKLNNADGTVALTSLSMANATPGTIIYANLPVTNAGTVNFTYAFSTASTNSADATPLNANLNWSLVSNGTSATCNATTYGTGTVVSPVTTLAATAAVSGRALAAGATENLCFKVELPTTAPAGVQGRTTVATVSFVATQS